MRILRTIIDDFKLLVATLKEEPAYWAAKWPKIASKLSKEEAQESDDIE